MLIAVDYFRALFGGTKRVQMTPKDSHWLNNDFTPVLIMANYSCRSDRSFCAMEMTQGGHYDRVD